MPGPKNGWILLSDAIKKKTPDEAPFPAGLLEENSSNENNDNTASEEIDLSTEKTNEDETLPDISVDSEEAKDES